MTRIWRLLAGVVLLSAAACVPLAPATAPRAGVVSRFATQLAGPATFLPPMPTAVVVLKPGDLNRNRAFCSAFMTLPTAQEAMAGSAVAPNLILTRWLVQLPEVPADRAFDCDFLVGTYDYARAARLIAAARLSAGSLAGRGPFLLMVIPDSTGLHVVGLDGSSYDDAGFGAFVASWGSALNQSEQRITATPDQPGLVRSLFDLVAAILRTATGAAGGLITGAVAGL